MFLLLLNRSEFSIEKVQHPITVHNTEDSAIPLKQQRKLKHEQITIPADFWPELEEAQSLCLHE